ncbi:MULTISPECIES: toll/interleukin-1 receptor domain-containing protein [Streptomyces]|uniref:TIR domain-containing protein n=1 Tax=Streptomyces stelliscabiei TaxID=146820 RepID=A0A8I0PB43_9ACTN|nr:MULTISPECIES: toll/interleukin-1 receptor domain-containing protein [Streptomyces]KND46113.1 hypothetical protein IQ64_02955 [Streptomyces stelliscabiei]MBE1599220.1 hypothetical protein [Streptomyces stelliscabiei]MDX2520110.1 toll/interleukin-1 receptor domain-containing protein [Streptomyces stelliscabiei]MDX2556899.1 toll/interleukin-1 receptor domain-containing protein [Streptomyces stelliscabiei]MDX2616003.1 toll/interleukin-1 receptor domain-containing protein [Streptomyces stellisca
MSVTPDPLCRVVITYSRAEQHHRKTFRRHVADLERSGVEFFDDQDIPPGAPWETTLFGKLESADIIVLLLSSNYVSSDFCMEQEVPRALRRWKAGECQVFPVNVAPFDLTERSPLRQLQWIPSGKSVTEQGAAAAREWRRVAQELRKLVEGLGGATGGAASAANPAVAPASAANPASYAPGAGGKAPGHRPPTVTNSVEGSIVSGTVVQAGEIAGNVIIGSPRHPPADGPGS